MGETWALHIEPAAGRPLLLVVELAAEPGTAPCVHSAISLTARPDRCLRSLGWEPGLWQPRSYGAVTKVVDARPSP